MKISINELRRDLARELSAYTDEFVTLADLIVAHSLCIDRKTLLTLLDTEVDEATVVLCRDMVRRFASGVPLQYIFAECWFYGLPVSVGPGCFIPRSDTEILAAAAIELLPDRGRFADICCGSGCISLAIASNRPDVTGMALDYYHAPLSFAGENLSQYPAVSVERFDALEPEEYSRISGVDAVVCNPPYIPADEISMLETHVQAEPHTALDGGPDGLTFYRSVISSCAPRLGKGAYMMFEVGFGQSQDVAAMLESAGFDVSFRRDMGDIERVVIGELV